MFNCLFPYKNERFNAAFSVAGRALKAVVLNSSADRERLAATYLQARQKLEMTVASNDWKYLELGLWAEGVARWTEIEITKQNAFISDSLKSDRTRVRNRIPMRSGRIHVT